MYLAVVPVVCGEEMTARCIDSLLAQDVETSVFAIDNGSRDCSELLRSYGKRISRIAYAQSRSLSRVWNEALDMAFRSLKLDSALVVNNDTVLRPDTMRLLLVDGGEFVTGVGVDTTEQLEQVDVTSKSPHPTFSMFLIRKSVWDKVGKFDERYWAWAVDGDMHLRMDRAGIDAYAIGLPFLHLGSGTINKLREDDYERHVDLCKKSDADRAAFMQEYGFAVGSPEYYASFRTWRDNKYEKTGRL